VLIVGIIASLALIRNPQIFKSKAAQDIYNEVYITDSAGQSICQGDRCQTGSSDLYISFNKEGLERIKNESAPKPGIVTQILDNTENTLQAMALDAPQPISGYLAQSPLFGPPDFITRYGLSLDNLDQAVSEAINDNVGYKNDLVSGLSALTGRLFGPQINLLRAVFRLPLDTPDNAVFSIAKNNAPKISYAVKGGLGDISIEPPITEQCNDAKPKTSDVKLICDLLDYQKRFIETGISPECDDPNRNIKYPDLDEICEVQKQFKLKWQNMPAECMKENTELLVKLECAAWQGELRSLQQTANSICNSATSQSSEQRLRCELQKSRIHICDDPALSAKCQNFGVNIDNECQIKDLLCGDTKDQSSPNIGGLQVEAAAKSRKKPPKDELERKAFEVYEKYFGPDWQNILFRYLLIDDVRSATNEDIAQAQQEGGIGWVNTQETDYDGKIIFNTIRIFESAGTDDYALRTEVGEALWNLLENTAVTSEPPMNLKEQTMPQGFRQIRDILKSKGLTVGDVFGQVVDFCRQILDTWGKTYRVQPRDRYSGLSPNSLRDYKSIPEWKSEGFADGIAVEIKIRSGLPLDYREQRVYADLTTGSNKGSMEVIKVVVDAFLPPISRR